LEAARDMEKEKLESLIIDYIDNKLNTADRQMVEQELVNNPEAYTLYEQLKEVIHVMDRAAGYEPSAKLKAGFEEMLKSESASLKENKETKTIFFRPAFFRVAAAVALLILGGGMGFWISKYNAQQDRLALIEKQVQEDRRIMMAMIGDQQSASQRIQGVSVAMKIEKADDQVVNALIKAMNEDPNTNVRLAALEALSNFQHEPHVRKALIESLSKQSDPVVQISLIQLMVKMKEKSIVNDLQRIVDDAETMKAVKDEAYTGIMKLS
jgi:anti-sigma factor RsiW